MTQDKMIQTDAAIEAAKMGFDELARRSNTVPGSEVVDKETLLGVEMIIVDAVEHEGDYGPFISCTCKLRDGSLVVFNDGSTGIYKQISSGDVALPLYCKRGLRKSTYPNPNGKGESTTYYLTSGTFR